MSKLILYHGSPEIVRKPLFGKGRLYNDYESGFYCTEHIELGNEWACSENSDGYVNKYEIDISGLRVLNLSSNEYTILHWLALLVKYRKPRITTPNMRKGVEWLENNYLIDISLYDIIIGYRADDSYFSFARAFLNNEISLYQLSYAMRLGALEEQVVLKSEKAFDEIKFIGLEEVSSSKYFVRRKARDDAVRQAFQDELERVYFDDLYMRDIICKEVKEDDPRIR